MPALRSTTHTTIYRKRCDMSNRQNTQKKACLDYLREHGSITGAQAWESFGCYRLSSVIKRLRNDGYNIRTEIVGDERYGRYWLEEECNG